MTPVDPQAQALAKTEEHEATESLALIENLPVESAEDFENVASILNDVKLKARKVEAVRKSFVDPLNKAIKAINDFFRPPITAYGMCESLLKDKLSDYVNHVEVKRDSLLHEAEAYVQDGDMKMAEGAIVEAETAIVPKVDGLSMRTDWIGEVEDETLIPREYLVPDVSKLIALTKATKGNPNIPGWKAYPRTITTVRVKES